MPKSNIRELWNTSVIIYNGYYVYLYHHNIINVLFNTNIPRNIVLQALFSL